MLPYQLEILDTKLPFFLNNLILDSTFFAYVRERQLLNEDSIQDIEAQTTERKEIVRFTELLKKQAPKKFNIFMDILKLTKQDHVFKEVKNARHKKIKYLPKSPDIEKNAKQKLFSDLVPSRLSTSERDQLVKLFVLKEDYEEMNEDKHIQMQENEQLQTKLESALETAEYEMKHHKLVKEEYDKLKKVKDDMREQLNKQKWVIQELKEKVEEQEKKEKQYLLSIDEQKQHVESMEKLLQDLKHEQNMAHLNRKSIEKDNIDGTAPMYGIEMTDMDNNLPENATEIMKIQKQIENLRNVSHTFNDFTPGHIQNLKTELSKLCQLVNDILDHCDPEEGASVFEAPNFSDKLEHDQTENNTAKENTSCDNIHIRNPYKTKHHKKDNHPREKARMLNIETELSVLKQRIKVIEEQREEQNSVLKMKEKQLREEQRQVVMLRQTLRSYKGIRLQQPKKLKTQKSYDYLPLYNPPAATSVQTISFEPSSSRHNESYGITPRTQNDKKSQTLTLSLPSNCLKANAKTQSFPHLKNQNYLVAKPRTPSISQHNSLDEYF